MSNTRGAVGPSLTIRRTFNAPRERVFAAWTQPEELKNWFGPPGFTIPELAMDVRTGGKYRIVMVSPEGEKHIVDGVFSEVRKPERLAYTWRWEEDDGSKARDTFVTIEFHDKGKETEMVFTHEGFASEESRENHNKGWTGIFEKLAAYLA
jgi:uncharacterized protein YndB with AHSA1/START domain